LPIEFENLTAESIISLAEYLKNKQLLNTLEQEYELLSVRSEIENLDNKARLKELKEKVSELKEKSTTIPESISLFENFDKQKILSERLDKLENKRDSIQEEVYLALKNEYLSELTDLNKEVQLLVKHLEIRREQTKPVIQVLNFQVEEMQIRKEIEDLSEEDFQAKINKLNQELQEKKQEEESIDIILQQVKK
jgi:chromosome segregation ATPase